MYVHRVIWAGLHGPIPKGWVVHHLNGDLWDNRPHNLAAVPRETKELNQIIAPYRKRIRELELRLQKEN